MTDAQQSGKDPYAVLDDLLVATGGAHHDATGDRPDHDWSEWYAEYLSGKIDGIVGFSPDVETIRRWLLTSDERYRTEEPDEAWPSAYARYILDDYATDHAQ